MFPDKQHFGLSKPNPENANAACYADGNTYLHELCRINASADLVREAVLKLGASVEIRNKKDMTALGVAIQSGNAELVECLLNLGSEMFFEVDKNRNFNALFLAVYTGQEKIVKLLLDNNADIFVNRNGITPEGKFEGLPCLHMAIKLGHSDIISSLISAGAFLDMEGGPEKLSPLQLAAQLNRETAIVRLLAAGAELDQPQSGSGLTALHHALMNDWAGATKRLLEAGANVEAVTDAGLTPLMYAAGHGNLVLTRLVLEAGADVDAQRSYNGETALMLAAVKNNAIEVVRLLLNSGADPLLTDAFNRTASRHADNSHLLSHRALLRDAEMIAEQKFFEKNYRKHRP